MAEKRKAKGAAAGPKGADFRFKIGAYTPETIPMARLADYLVELAKVLGHEQSVHLVELESGSTAVVHRVEHDAIPKVVARARGVTTGEAPQEAQRAYDRINKYLREDNAAAVLRRGKRGTKILEFPGVSQAEEVFTVSQLGSISGEIVRVGGTQEQVPVLLETEGRQLSGCHTNRQLAKQLAQHLFEQVRLTGQGYWFRNADGDWELNHFRIDHFETLSDANLTTALHELRGAVGKVPESAYEDVISIRSGGAGNGGA